jgi:hypothetical protein
LGLRRVAAVLAAHRLVDQDVGGAVEWVLHRRRRAAEAAAWRVDRRGEACSFISESSRKSRIARSSQSMRQTWNFVAQSAGKRSRRTFFEFHSRAVRAAPRDVEQQRVVVELHDVDLAVGGPRPARAERPERRPRSGAHVDAGADLEPAVDPRVLAARVDAGRGVVDELAVAHPRRAVFALVAVAADGAT